jgi:cell wall-associated NlpC family hydrolase
MCKIKKLFIALPVVILFFLLTAGFVYAENIGTGTITGDSVNVRSNPDTSAKVIIQLAKGAKVNILANEGDWCKVTYSDSTGWIFSQFLTIRDEAIAAGTINATDVNVRSKPDTSSEVLTKLDKSAKVSIYERSGDWCRIKIGEDRYGWVNKEYITLRGESVSRGLTNEITPPVEPDTNEDTSSVSDEEKDIRQQVVAYAKKFIGVRYVYGGTSPKGFDCSGFVQYVFKHFGITLERSAADQGQHGTKIDRSDLRPGDLVFFDTNGGLNGIKHVGIYIGDGEFIHASSGSDHHRVVISDLTEGFYNKSYMRSRQYIED